VGSEVDGGDFLLFRRVLQFFDLLVGLRCLLFGLLLLTCQRLLLLKPLILQFIRLGNQRVNLVREFLVLAGPGNLLIFAFLSKSLVLKLE